MTFLRFALSIAQSAKGWVERVEPKAELALGYLIAINEVATAGAVTYSYPKFLRKPVFVVYARQDFVRTWSGGIKLDENSVGKVSDGRIIAQTSVGPGPTEYTAEFIPWAEVPTE